MNTILLGVLPVFSIMGIGWGLRVSKVIPENAWSPIERLAYFVFYPGFLIPAAWKADFANGSAGALGLSTIASVIVVALAVLAVRPFLKITGPAFTSVFQGALRWNSFVFLPLTVALYGDKGSGLAAIVLGALIPAINIMSVLVMTRWGEGQGGGWRGSLTGLAANPVIWSCAIGLALNLLHVPKPEIVMSALKLLSDAALAVGLIVAGGGLSFTYALSRPWLIGGVSAVKLLVLPILMWTLCRALGGDATALGIALICGSAPGAAASYVLARQMGGDARLMAGIVAFTTAASLITIPVLLAIFGVTAG
ncbi:MAG: AEC family transporter [Alphaproteobacteria bacterium]